MSRKRISVVIPAYNEEKNLEGAVKSVLGIVPKYSEDYEIIVIDDGSKDKTPQIVDRLAKNNTKIRGFHNRPNRGFGATYWRGVENTRFEYTMMVWGDNAHTAQSLHKILSKIGEADVVIPNYTNLETRTWLRRNLSKLFTWLVNRITGLDVRYYNGTTLYRSKLLKAIPRKSTGFGFQAEVLAYVLKNGASYIQVNTLRRSTPDEVSAAFKLRNIVSVGGSLLWLLWQFRIK